ncbi:MAG: DUF4922 domain-containing protein [Muribaculaceae bacterium]|nr:DUF4922 domain-containing protein [Muribaculaceae bacterium]
MSTELSTYQLERFIDSQIAEWDLADAGYSALKNVRVKSLNLDGMLIKVQFNPARIVSTSAKIDNHSLSSRPCFLCDSNRPDKQKSIEWGRYNILVNPYPIFPRHLTIASKDHVAQTIYGRIGEMFALAKSLNGYTIFYNGARCGASAPDHMHFQAGNSDFLPLDKWIQEAGLTPILSDSNVVLSEVLSAPVKFFIIDAIDAVSADSAFCKLRAGMPVTEDDVEPMMNLLAYTIPLGIRLVVIPRKRHRPSFYGSDGKGTMMISPGAVDMAGVLITPREQDFETIDDNIVRKIYSEVSLNTQDINKISSYVKKHF